MRRTTNWTAAALLAAVSTICLAGDGAPPAGGQPNPPATPPAGASKDAAAADYIKDVQAKQSKQSDQEAKDSIKKLVEFWKDKDVTDATKKPIPDVVGKYAREDKMSVATDAIDALGEFGAAGAPPTTDALERTLKAKDPSVDVYKHCFDTLKKLADTKPSTVKTLTDCLKFKIDEVVGKAADAMSGYKAAPGKVRKVMFEEILNQTQGVASQAKSAKNAGMVHKWQVIGGNVIAALNALSGQTFKDPDEARKWFNDNKGAKMWDS